MRPLRSEVTPRSATAGRPSASAATKIPRASNEGPSIASAPADPTVLLVGADQGFEPALRAALARHRVYVETSSAESALETVIVTAPDLVLLTDDAAADSGRALLSKFAASPSSSVVPVAILDDNPALDQRLQAFRHGAAAVIPRSASIDAIAEHVAKLAREIPERGGEVLGQVGEATLSEFVSALGSELRSGILTVQTGDEPVRLVLGSGRPLTAFIDDFVTRVRRHVVHAEPLKYEFDDRAAGTIKLLDSAEDELSPSHSGLAGLRVVLADGDSARADAVAQELRSRGAIVVVTDLSPTEARFARLRQVDPQILIVGERELLGHGYELLRRMRQDTRLRWAALLVVRWEEVWSDTLSVPALDRLESALDTLAEADRSLIERAATSELFDTRLEVTGPARLLRALVTTPHPLRVSVHNPRLTVAIDISEGLIVGASAQTGEEPSASFEGALALAGLMVLTAGRVHVQPVRQPATTNVMSTIDVALNMADAERAPIAPSMPVPASAGPSLIAAPPQNSPTEPAPTQAPLISVRPRTSIEPARERIGINKPLALALVALACLQGLLVAGLLGSLSKRSRAASAALSSVHEARNTATTSSQPSSAPPATAAAPPEPSAAPSEPSAASGAPPVPSAAPAPTTTAAPTCSALLGTLAGDSGSPGAAYEQQQRGAKALVQGKLEDAQLAYCKAALWDAENPQAHIDLAQVLLLRKDGAAAANEARKAIQLDSKSLRAQALLGDALLQTGDVEGAKGALLAAAGVDASDEKALSALVTRALHEAEVSLKKRDPARAERFFRRAAALDPSRFEASRGLSNVLSQLGDAAGAARAAESAIAREPRDPGSHVALGDALFHLGDKAGAEREWREAARLDPSFPDAQRRIKKLRNL